MRWPSLSIVFLKRSSKHYRITSFVVFIVVVVVVVVVFCKRGEM